MFGQLKLKVCKRSFILGLKRRKKSPETVFLFEIVKKLDNIIFFAIIIFVVTLSSA